MNTQIRSREELLADLNLANNELEFQRKEKKKHASELIIANKNLEKIIAESKNAALKLFKSAQESRAMVENNPDIIERFDKDFRYLYINHPLPTITNNSFSNIVGKTIRERGFSEDINSLYEESLNYVFSSGKEKTIEVSIPINGSLRYYESRWTPEFAEDGSVATALCISHEITERKLAIQKVQLFNKELFLQNEDKEKRAAELVSANQNLENSKKEILEINANLEKTISERTAMLEQSNKDLSQFARIASHDLQEPLRMVSSYTQLLQKRYKDKLDADANDFIHFAVDGAIRMQKLINDLLEYSNISAQSKKLELVDSFKILEKVIINLQKVIMNNTALISNSNLPILKTDETSLLRIFQNLIENAIKFKKKSVLPKITISCEKKNDMYEFSVSDNGIGIDMEYHDRVFIIFQRLHSANDYTGTGIGLSICKRIVELNGGTIWFKSKENEGTTFYFTVPIKH